MEYRPVPDSRVADYQRFLNYAFTPTQSFPLPDSEDDLPAPSRVSDRRGLFEGETLRAVCGQFWLDLRVRGDFRPVGGLAEVATLPEDRHQGLVSRLVRESLAEYRKRDCTFSALWPFEYPFYRKYGWATVSRHARTTLDPGAIEAVVSGRDGDRRLRPDGEFVRIDADRWRELAAVYEQCNRRPLSMRRTETWWRNRVLSGWGDDPRCYGIERGGDLAGYVVYSFDSIDEGTRLDVDELGYVDGEAFRDLLRFCFYHDAQIEEVRLHGPIAEAFELQDLLAEPERLGVEIRPGAMVRLVDVSRALETLEYPADGAIVLDVADRVVDENDARFSLRVDGDDVACEPTDEPPEIELDVGTLAQIVVGHRSVSAAEAAGDVEGETEPLADLFPPVSEQPYLREWF